MAAKELIVYTIIKNMTKTILLMFVKNDRNRKEAEFRHARHVPLPRDDPAMNMIDDIYSRELIPRGFLGLYYSSYNILIVPLIFMSINIYE